MTKYVVNSGGLKNQPERAKKYFAELFFGAGSTPRILWCFFASDPQDYEKHFAHYIASFSPWLPTGIEPQHVLAMIDNFAAEVAEADVVYIHGGSYENIYKLLAGQPLVDMLAHKVVGLNSASSMLFAVAAWSCDTFEITEGLGILPFKFIPHYKVSTVPNGKSLTDNVWEAAYKELEAYGDTSVPVHALEEGEFVTIEV